jgi:hypothetical protein
VVEVGLWWSRWVAVWRVPVLCWEWCGHVGGGEVIEVSQWVVFRRVGVFCVTDV